MIFLKDSQKKFLQESRKKFLELFWNGLLDKRVIFEWVPQKFQGLQRFSATPSEFPGLGNVAFQGGLSDFQGFFQGRLRKILLVSEKF